MRAAVLYDIARMEIRDVPAVAPGPGDVVIRPTAVGLCGTDFHIFEGHGNYNTDERGRRIPLAEQPQILGHEVVGVVEAVGREVRDLRAGNRVVVDQGRSCGGLTERCEYCATGYSHQCEYYREHGITGLPGGLAELLVMPAVNAVKREAALPEMEAALTEPLACIMHAMDAARLASQRYTLDGRGGSRARTVLVTGAGPAGLLFVQYLRNVLGYEGRVLVSEPDAAKRALAAQFGAQTIDPSSTSVGAAVLELTGGRRAEWLIEASGSSQVFIDLPVVTRKLATVVLYGHGHAGVDVSVLSNIQYREPCLVTPTGASGAFDADGRPAVYRAALGLIEAGRISVAPFITHRYCSLDAVPGAFGGDHRQPGYIKGVVKLSE
jgi:L-iditol 2-dehydrogenase